ncbi:MAG TPA: Na+/H+ antiporter NhaA, partial [Dehalococcoidia bacterium]|nr:Na+/H+ antiporter NhaA [Dehalococcoidia bacterium]
ALPKGMTIAHLVGVSVLGGIGFTVSLFITDLAFTDAQFQGEAKAGVFAASIVAAVLGLLILRILTPSAPKEVEAEP